MQPIVLWTAKATLRSDDACTTILGYQLASLPSATQAPYYQPPSAKTSPTLSYVPPLVYFCIQSLIEYPDQVHLIGPTRLPYKQPTDGHDFDILQALIPTYRPFSPHFREFDLRLVDPRLWAVLAQIYEDLPSAFREYTLPLSDVHLPLLQAIPSTDHFSLVTVLSLSKCRELTDDTVLELRYLHTLAALDASVTALGTWGVQRLARSLSWTDGDGELRPERRGPWGLRVLYLKDCMNVDSKVLDSLSRFPLLSVVDLRGTTCKPWQHKSLSFHSSSDKGLFQHGALSEVLGHLASLTKTPRTLFSHPAPYVLNIDSLYHKVNPTPSYRLPTTLWGVEGPDTRPAEELVQVAHHGRMDVFLPRKLPRLRSESPPYTDYEPWPVPQISGNTDELYPEEDDYDMQQEYGVDGYNEEDEYSEEEVGYGTDESDGPSRPYDMSEDPFAQALRRARRRVSPQPELDTWMDEVADKELEQYKKQRLVDRFYTFSGPRPVTSLSDLPGRGVDPLSSTSESSSHAPADPLMLFRTPPPWSSLPSTPPAKPRSASTVSSTLTLPPTTDPSTTFDPSPKRRRVEEVAPADQARKRMHAVSSIQNMFNMVHKRTADVHAKAASTGQTKGQHVLSGSVNVQPRPNPFARPPGAQSRKTPRLNMQPAGPLESVAVDRAKAASKLQTTAARRTDAGTTAAASTTGNVRAPEAGTRTNDAHPLVLKEASSRLPSTRAPDKPASSHPSGSGGKLKPITTLPVPDLPVNVKPLSAHRRPQAPIAAKAKQTVLPVCREASSPKPKPLSGSKSAAAKPPSGRRVSAPASVPSRSNCGPAEASAKSKNTPAEPQSKARLVKGKKPNGFDWKRWSSGPK